MEKVMSTMGAYHAFPMLLMFVIVTGCVQPDSGPKYQAVAFSPSTGNIGYSFDFPEVEEARNTAVEFCQSDDCTVLITNTSCISYSVNPSNKSGRPTIYESLSVRDVAPKLEASCGPELGRCVEARSICPSGETNLLE